MLEYSVLKGDIEKTAKLIRLCKPEVPVLAAAF
jgi:hypothetical protein